MRSESVYLLMEGARDCEGPTTVYRTEQEALAEMRRLLVTERSGQLWGDVYVVVIPVGGGESEVIWPTEEMRRAQKWAQRAWDLKHGHAVDPLCPRCHHWTTAEGQCSACDYDARRDTEPLIRGAVQ